MFICCVFGAEAEIPCQQHLQRVSLCEWTYGLVLKSCSNSANQSIVSGSRNQFVESGEQSSARSRKGTFNSAAKTKNKPMPPPKKDKVGLTIKAEFQSVYIY